MSLAQRLLMAGTNASASGPAGYYIDTDNPLSAGLIMCTLPGTRENLVYPVGDSRRTEPVFMFGTTVNDNGTSMDTTGASVNAQNKMGLRIRPSANGPIVGSLGEWTVAVCATNLGALAASPGSNDESTDQGQLGGGNTLYCERGDGDTGGSICKLEFAYVNGATQFFFTYRNLNGNLLQVGVRADGVGDPGDPNHRFVAMMSVSGTEHAVRHYNPTGVANGQVNPIDGSNAQYFGNNHTAHSTVIPMLGCDWWDNRAAWKGAIHSGHAWNRKLSVSEWDAFKVSPQQLIKKR